MSQEAPEDDGALKAGEGRLLLGDREGMGVGGGLSLLSGVGAAGTPVSLLRGRLKDRAVFL